MIIKYQNQKEPKPNFQQKQCGRKVLKRKSDFEQKETN